MTGTSVVNVKEEMAKELAGYSDRVQNGDFIKCTKQKTFKLPTGEETAGPIYCVILDFVSGNFFYDRPWKEGEVMAPACFALGVEKNELLKPHETAPAKEAASCDPEVCPNNVFGSKGAGKACANNRILAVLLNPDSTDPKQPVYYLKLSPTAIKPFDAYIGRVRNEFKTTPIGVITELYFDPNSSHQSVRFGKAKENVNLQAHWGKKEAALKRLLSPPDVSNYEAPKGGKK